METEDTVQQRTVQQRVESSLQQDIEQYLEEYDCPFCVLPGNYFSRALEMLEEYSPRVLVSVKRPNGSDLYTLGTSG